MPLLHLISNQVKSVVVLIKDVDQQIEGLRLSLLQDDMEVKMETDKWQTSLEFWSQTTDT